jgi:hypothetical protein
MVIVLYMSRCLGLTFYSSGWLIRSPTSLAAAVPSQGWQTPNVFLCFPLPLRQALNMQDLYPHLAMCRHMSTSILNYVYIYIHVHVCVYVLPHPLSFQFNCANKDLPHISYRWFCFHIFWCQDPRVWTLTPVRSTWSTGMCQFRTHFEDSSCTNCSHHTLQVTSCK